MKLKQYLKGKMLLLSLSLCMLTACAGESTTAESGQSASPDNSNVQNQEDGQQGSQDQEENQDEATTLDRGETPVKVLMLTGPTGMGAAKLMADNDAETTENWYEVETVADNSQVVAMLSSGETDIAAISTSVAATLYAKTENISVLAVNTMGVLYLLEKGETINTMADLAGKTIWTTGQGANPEYILNKLLDEVGLDASSDVNIEWMTAEEVSAKMVASEDGICMLPVPASTALMMKDEAVNQVLDLSAEWSSLVGTVLPMGCVVARQEFIEENPERVEKFLKDYEASIHYMKADGDDQASLVTEYGITPSEAVASNALPYANLTFMTGATMQSNLQSYFTVMFEANPDSIGGGLPYDDFYYVATS